MKRVGIIGTAALSLLLGTAAPVWSQQGKQDEEQAKSDKQAKGKGSAKADSKQQTKGQAQKAAPRAKGEPQQPEAQQQNQKQKQQEARQDQRGQQQKEQNQQRAEQQKQVNQERQATRQKQVVDDRQDANRQRQANQQKQVEDRKRAEQVRVQPVRVQPVRVQPVRAQQQADNRPPGWDKGKKVGWDGGTVPPGHQARLPRERQQVLITEQRTRRVEYSRYLDQQRARQREWAAQLQQQRRMTYYRYQQDYWSRLRRQQLALQRNYNYYNDPYFYTAPSYSYSYGNNSFQTNQYGANLLRQAVNNGYAEGYRAGQADRQDRFGGGYQNSYAYQDANLGYNGLYVNQGDYNYYFREGFNRGYQDGYNNQMQYGQYSNGNRSILGTILSAVLNLQSLR